MIHRDDPTCCLTTSKVVNRTMRAKTKVHIGSTMRHEGHGYLVENKVGSLGWNSLLSILPYDGRADHNAYALDRISEYVD
eukprot:637341-Amorphochlora_amoeboformis.AAC.1